MLQTLGLRLVVEELGGIEQIEKRLTKRRRATADAGNAMQANKRKQRRPFAPFRKSPEFARLMRSRQILNQAPKQRSAIAPARQPRPAGARGGQPDCALLIPSFPTMVSGMERAMTDSEHTRRERIDTRISVEALAMIEREAERRRTTTSHVARCLIEDGVRALNQTAA